MVFQQFDRARDGRQRGLELMADGIGEIPQVTGTLFDGIGHDGEILVEGLDLQRRGGRNGRRRPAALRQLAGGGAQDLDGPGDAARQQTRQAHQNGEDGASPERDLAGVLIHSPEQRARRARKQQHARHLPLHHDRPRIMDADVGGAAQPFEPVDLAIIAIAPQGGVGIAAQG